MDGDVAPILGALNDVETPTKDLMMRLREVALEPRIGRFTAGNKTAPQAAQHNRLLSLSPELRNMIYEVLVEVDNIEIPKDGKLVRPPLLKVCQQVAEEASTIFYGLNRFKSTNNRLGELSLWLARLPLKLRRSINVIDLCYESDTEMNNMVQDLHTGMTLGYESSDQTYSDSAERLMKAAERNFLNAALQTALLGLDLNAFRLPTLPPISDSAGDPSQTDLAVLIRNTLEELASLYEKAWVRGAELKISFYSDERASRRFQQHRGDEEWLRKVATDTKDEMITASLPDIISIIQG